MAGCVLFAVFALALAGAWVWAGRRIPAPEPTGVGEDAALWASAERTFRALIGLVAAVELGLGIVGRDPGHAAVGLGFALFLAARPEAGRSRPALLGTATALFLIGLFLRLCR